MKKIQNNQSGYIPQPKKTLKKEKKKVAKIVTFWLLILFMVFTVIGSGLGIYSFSKTVSANTTSIAFNGSNVYIPMSYTVINDTAGYRNITYDNRIDDTDYYATVGYLSLKLDIMYDSNTGKHNFYFVQPYQVVENAVTNPYSKAFPFIFNSITLANSNGKPLPPSFVEYFYASNTYVDTFTGDNLSGVSSLYLGNSTNNNALFNFNQYVDINNTNGFKTYFYFICQNYYTDTNLTNSNRAFFDMYVSTTGQIISDITSVSMSTIVEDNRIYNVIDYTCSNNNVLSIGFRITNKVNTNDTFTVLHYQPNNTDFNYNSSIMPYSLFKYDFRRYLFVATGTGEYQQGYQDGIISNQPNVWQDGYNQGKKDGLVTGEQIGYNNGYTDGVNGAENYTFLNLMTSIVDAPLTAVRGMLNFEVLGFNMYEFFTSIVAVCVVVAILKFIF